MPVRQVLTDHGGDPPDLPSRATGTEGDRVGQPEPAFRAALVETLTERDDSLLAAYVDDERAVTAGGLRAHRPGQAAGAGRHAYRLAPLR
jgi:hypothetical protein